MMTYRRVQYIFPRYFQSDIFRACHYTGVGRLRVLYARRQLRINITKQMYDVLQKVNCTTLAAYSGVLLYGFQGVMGHYMCNDIL